MMGAGESAGFRDPFEGHDMVAPHIHVMEVGDNEKAYRFGHGLSLPV